MLCEHEGTVVLLDRIFKALGIEVEHVQYGDTVIEKLARDRFDTVVVDDVDPENAVAVLEAAKALPAGKKCLGVMLADPHCEFAGNFRGRSSSSRIVCEPILVKTALPDMTYCLTGWAELVWQDAEGHLGVRFMKLAVERQRALHDWLAAECSERCIRR